MTESSLPKDYVLGRNYAASSRLNYQFYLWKETLQFNLHPRIPVPGPEQKLCIADIATGTGIWLVDVARNFSTAQLDGFDISLTQCPPKQWLPKNINFRVWNMFEDVPDDLHGKYDIVHIRLVYLMIQNDDPLPIIRNLIKMLKPNGYLQWDELDGSRMYTVSTDPSVTTSLMGNQWNAFDQTNKWFSRLPETLRNEGFSDASLYHYQDHLSELKAFYDMYIMGFEEVASSTFKGTVQGKKMMQEAKEMDEESKSGTAMCVPKAVCVAKKAG